MNIIIALLSLIALFEALRFASLHRKISQKRFFTQKCEGVEKMMWDLKFKVFKTKEIREDVRKEYSYMKSRVDTLENQIKNWPPEKDEEERKRLEDNRVLAERDAQRLENQMKELDEEVNGAKPTIEDPNGRIGIMEQIDSLAELQGMLKDYIKGL